MAIVDDLAALDVLLDEYYSDSNCNSNMDWLNFSNVYLNNVISYTKQPAKRQKRERKTKDICTSDGITRISLSRMIATDIRKSYANMMVNVMNAAEMPLMYGWLDTFFAPNLTRTSSKSFQICSAMTGNNQKGALEIAQHWYDCLSYCPDVTVALQDSRLLTFTDGRDTQVQANIRFTCTRIYDENLPIDLLRETSVISSQVSLIAEESCSTVLATDLDISDDNNSDASSSADDSEARIVGGKRYHASLFQDSPNALRESMRAIDSRSPARLKLREKPIHVVAEGQLTMSLNAQSLITKIVMNTQFQMSS